MLFYGLISRSSVSVDGMLIKYWRVMFITGQKRIRIRQRWGLES